MLKLACLLNTRVVTCSSAQTRLAPVPSATLRLAMRLTTVSSALSWRIEDTRTGKSKGTAPLRNKS